MLYWNWETMRYEREGDKRPDLLAEKLEDWGNDYDEPGADNIDGTDLY